MLHSYKNLLEKQYIPHPSPFLVAKTVEIIGGHYGSIYGM
jgi:hypothetical protein